LLETETLDEPAIEHLKSEIISTPALPTPDAPPASALAS
jgi:hypothetical protein